MTNLVVASGSMDQMDVELYPLVVGAIDNLTRMNNDEYIFERRGTQER